MAEVINANVFDVEKKFVDFGGLDYFWSKAKAYVDAADKVTAEKVAALETTVNGTANAEGVLENGLVQKVAALRTEVDALGGTNGGIQGMIDSSIAALDLPNTYEAKGEAAKAEAAAKAYADSLAVNYEVAGAAKTAEDNAKAYADSLAGNYDAAGTAKGFNEAMDTRVKVLEAIDHNKIAEDAAATAVAGVIDGAPEKFDTLKEIAAWIAEADTAEDAASLVTRVSALEAIDHDAYKAADETVLASAKSYADGLASNYDAAGSAAAAEAAAKSYADGKFQVAGNYEEAGAAAQALTDAKKYADDTFQVKGNYEAAGTADAKIAALDLPNTYEAKGAAATAKSEAIAQAKLDTAEVLKGYYTKTETDNLLSANSTADQAYAKSYTDQLFNSIKFASNSDIDTIFA